MSGGGGGEQDKLKDEVAELSARCNLPGVQFLQKVGSGGSGTVYKAFQPTVGRFVAVKVINSVDSPTQLNNEAKLSKLLDHESVCKIYSYGQTTDGGFYLIMEWIEGESLAQVLQREKFLDASHFIEVMERMLAAVRMAHEQGVVHRDLKPANMMLCKPDSDDHFVVKVIDFGIARHSPGNNSQDDTKHTTSLCGSPFYMSPEQCRNERGDERSDIYSLGVIMYECITGTTPFVGNTPMELMYKHSNEPAPRFGVLIERDSLRAFERLVLRCLQKNPDERYRTVSELQSAFETAAKECCTTPNRAAVAIGKVVLATVALAGCISVIYPFLNPAKQPEVKPPVRAARGLDAWTLYRRLDDNKGLSVASKQAALRDLLSSRVSKSIKSLSLCRLITLAVSNYERKKLTLQAIKQIDSLTEFDSERSKEKGRFHEAADKLVSSGMNTEATLLLESESRAERRVPLLRSDVKFGLETYRRLLWVYTFAGDWNRAAEALRAAKVQLNEIPDTDTRLYWLLIETEQARTEEFRRDYLAAKRHYSHACGVEIEEDERAGWVVALLPAASFYGRHGETARSEQLFDSAFLCLQAPKAKRMLKSLKYNVDFRRSRTRGTAGQLGSSDEKLVASALKLIAGTKFEGELDKDQLGELFETRAEYLLALGRVNEAATCIEQSLRYYGETPEILPPARSRLAWVRGGIEFARGNRESAASFFLEAIENSPSLEFSARDPLIHKQMRIAAKLPLTGVSDAQLSNLRKAVEVKPDGFPCERI